MHQAAGLCNLIQDEVFLPDKVIDSLIKIAPRVTEGTIHEALACLKLKGQWVIEVSTIICDFDHGGWEALHLAMTTASTLTYTVNNPSNEWKAKVKSRPLSKVNI